MELKMRDDGREEERREEEKKTRFDRLLFCSPTLGRSEAGSFGMTFG